ncbi:hypothetical protein [Agromyces neolithicus]|uniref:Uncharacterized protein n=1 Tax=Agromyces neolithicus TaxID=269420 RepID=A0ABP4YNF9_9MICO
MDEESCALPSNWASCAGNALTDSASDNFAKSMAEGFDQIFKEFATSWIGQGMLVDLNSANVEWFKYSLSMITAFLAVIGIAIAGARVAYYHRGEEFGQIMRALARLIFVATAGTAAVSILLLLGDSFGKWVLDSAGLTATTLVVSSAITAIAPGLAIVLGLFGILAVMCQWGIMLVRGAILPLLIGFWPTAAAVAMIKGGEQAFDGVTKWLLAFIIYSPIAASIYALAWRLNSNVNDLAGVVTGVILIILAVAALPALMRLLGPVSSALGKATGGGMAMGVTSTAVAAGVAVGATVATAGAAGAGAGAAAAGGGSSTAATTAPPTASTGATATETAGSTGADGAVGGSGATGSTGAEGAVGDPGASGANGAAGAGDSSASAASGSSGGRQAMWNGAQAATDGRGDNNSAEGMVSE